MAVCDYCAYRNGWNCDDGWNRQKGGCNSFKLDWDTLTEKQKKSIRNQLILKEYNDYD